MNIKILGNGGFYNEGLPYNAMAIDGHVLVETPPDILQSLMQQGMSPAQMDTVFISHIHGDHCFGFPFFFFNWLYWGDSGSHYNRGTRLVVIGPEGFAGHLRELMRLAIPPEHPYLRDFDQRVQIVEIDEDDVIAVKGNLWFGFRRTAHSLPTFSLIAGERGLSPRPRNISKRPSSSTARTPPCSKACGCSWTRAQSSSSAIRMEKGRTECT